MILLASLVVFFPLIVLTALHHLFSIKDFVLVLVQMNTINHLAIVFPALITVSLVLQQQYVFLVWMAICCWQIVPVLHHALLVSITFQIYVQIVQIIVQVVILMGVWHVLLVTILFRLQILSVFLLALKVCIFLPILHGARHANLLVLLALILLPHALLVMLYLQINIYWIINVWHLAPQIITLMREINANYALVPASSVSQQLIVVVAKVAFTFTLL